MKVTYDLVFYSSVGLIVTSYDTHVNSCDVLTYEFRRNMCRKLAEKVNNIPLENICAFVEHVYLKRSDGFISSIVVTHLNVHTYYPFGYGNPLYEKGESV